VVCGTASQLIYHADKCPSKSSMDQDDRDYMAKKKIHWENISRQELYERVNRQLSISPYVEFSHIETILSEYLAAKPLTEVIEKIRGGISGKRKRSCGSDTFAQKRPRIEAQETVDISTAGVVYHEGALMPQEVMDPIYLPSNFDTNVVDLGA
jgi:hypothetical protein